MRQIMLQWYYGLLLVPQGVSPLFPHAQMCTHAVFLACSYVFTWHCQGLPSEYWLLPEEHRRFLLPDTKGGEKHRRGIVLTISSRGVVSSTETRSATRASSSPSSPSPSPVMTRGLSPSLPPITACAANAPYPKWPQQHVQQGSAGGQLAASAPNVPCHESCALYAGQLPNGTANRMLRKLCGYFWFSLY